MAGTYIETAAVGYIRVSTDTQADQGVSLETQRESLMAYSLLHKLDLAEVVARARRFRPGRSRKSFAGVL